MTRRYDEYFLMAPGDVAGYVQARLSFFPAEADLHCAEIGDGNINYVFRLLDRASGRSLIVKQAGTEARISSEMRLSTDRGRIEAEILRLEHRYAPGMVPRLHLYDPVMCAMVMEDMTGHAMMRTALLRHEIFPHFAGHISTFMVDTLLPTTDLVMNPKDKKRLAADFINPDLCEISEDLVFTEPYNNQKGRNNVFPPNAEFVRREIYGDQALRLEAAKLKIDFMTKAQALIHGDLHTGSIFVTPDRTVVFDPEFAFYGPMGYDVGNIIANLFFIWANADATLSPPEAGAAYKGWAESTIADLTDLFINKFRHAFQRLVTEPLARTPGFLDWYLGTVLADTAGVCGLELIRRTVGLANVKDLTTIPDEGQRTRAERIMVFLAKDCILRRSAFQSGQDYLDALTRAVAKASESA